MQVRPLDTLASARAASALLAAVWRTDPAAPPLATEVLRAIEHAGGYACGAYRGDQLVGVSAGFLGLDAGAPLLHSHISGALEQGAGVGLALKLHQRAWALDRGIARVSWTFDPLVRRNAWFNLTKLGATGVEYLVDFYGPMTDGVNAGEATDRLFTVWDLAAPVPGVREAGPAQLALDEVGGAPRPLPTSGGDLLVRLPADVEALRRSDPQVAQAWRTAVREVLVPALADGRSVTGMTADGCLLLTGAPSSG
ncbi:MAG: hypothetical protein JWO60_1240 [Frankiales bacterium]|nr:hypothetical protein [Frankiales bacterium]